ncbi:uncharacterized protein [Leptinotarsa decemlineata]|uniref:uncharacterized protein n=1 Tax=Leptinotarsa decemlineata TaxID=7539 RepID=UPI003D305985
MKALFSLFAIIFIYIRSTNACNGYTISNYQISPCMENGIIKPINMSVVLDNDCNLIFTGCLNVDKALNMAVTKYTFNKPPMPSLKGTMDFCEIMKELQYPQVKQGLRSLGLPNRCPLSKGLKCGKGKNEKTNLGNLRKHLGAAAGTTTVRLDFEHDVGKSCVDIVITITKPRKG